VPVALPQNGKATTTNGSDREIIKLNVENDMLRKTINDLEQKMKFEVNKKLSHQDAEVG